MRSPTHSDSRSRGARHPRRHPSAVRGAGLAMPEINRRQAMVPDGADVLPNGFGTAPGLWLEHDGRVVVLLPGPPAELKPMVERVVAERLAPLAGGERLSRRVLRLRGRTESEVEKLAAPVYSRWAWAAADYDDGAHLAGPGRTAPVGARAAAAARVRLDRPQPPKLAVRRCGSLQHGRAALEAVVGELLRERGWRIGVAESCTGGLVSTRLTDVAGSSDYVRLQRRLLQQRGQGLGAQGAAGGDRRARSGERGGGRGDGGWDPRGRRRRNRRSASPASRDRRRQRAEARRHSGDRGDDGGRRRSPSVGRFRVRRRPRAGRAVPGLAGRA